MLKSFPAAINSAFPKAEMYSASDKKFIEICIQQRCENFHERFEKNISSKEIAENYLLELEEKWGEKYSLVIKLWQNNWENLSGYFKYSGPVRRLIYTTNPIEGLHRQIRKFTKTKGSLTSTNALYKQVYCAIKKVEQKWIMALPNWALTISQLDIFFPNRLKIELNSTTITL